MDLRETEEYLFSLGNEVETMKLGLENISTLLDALGRPQDKYLKVQVAGTNGKGSVCAFLDSICFQAGIKTGLYTSPHLISITERIKIGSVDIGEQEFAALATRVRAVSEDLVAKDRLERVPTFFEQVTAIALLAFAEAGVELAILETGLGGRFDAVTAANAEIAVITRIDLDHQEYLGDTIEKIAAEKAAIITSDTQFVIIGQQTHDVMRQLRNHCNNLGIEPLNDEYEPWRILEKDDGTVNVWMSLLDLPPIRLGLIGRHQVENAQTGLQTAKALVYEGLFLELETEDVELGIIKGLETATHPGRLERIGNFLLDGAHNPGGARALREYLDEFVDQQITMIFGAMRDKDIGYIAEILWPKAEKLIFTRPANSRAMDTHELLRSLPASIDRGRVMLAESVEESMDVARKASSESIIVVTGSLYLVGEVRKLLKDKQAI